MLEKLWKSEQRKRFFMIQGIRIHGAAAVSSDFVQGERMASDITGNASNPDPSAKR